jgi:uncharacterized protein (TIGR03437 family)
MLTWKDLRAQLNRSDLQMTDDRQHAGQILCDPASGRQQSGERIECETVSMRGQRRGPMAYLILNARSGRFRVISSAACFFIFSLLVYGQQPTCSVSAGSPTVHAEGLAEQVGDITLTCGGATGPVNTIIFVTLNANITNRLDASGALTNVTVDGATSLAPPTLNSPNTVFFASVQFPATGAIFTISGLRVAVPTISGGSGPQIVTGTVVATQVNLPANPLILGLPKPSLLSSVVNNGVPCLGSSLPTSINFANLVTAGTAFSTIRITEAFASAFAPKAPTADFGVRFLVNLSGYGPNAQVFVPDVIVGNRGTTPTSAGAFNNTAEGGTYTPGSNQLLLTRVSGADGTGAGGTLALAAIPGAATSFTSITQLSLASGAASVTYEVLDANPNLVDSAQIPVFVAVPATSCSAVLENTLGAMLAPVSNVSVATQTDPIPRYVATTPASDCTFFGDCAAAYFPVLEVTPTSITLNGSSLGQTQTAFIEVSNGGSSQLTFNASIAYQPVANQSSANWLSINGTTGVVDPAAGINNIGLNLYASPAALLAPSAYQATVTINAGSAGTITVPVTFNVGPAGPVIQSVVNSANSQPGAITAGSFATIYGLNLIAKNTATVTFDGFPATISYDGTSGSSATQINVLVPAGLGSATTAGVVATIDSVASNTFATSLVTNAPAVFNPGILNQNNSVNLVADPASPGDVIQIFLTGLATPVTLPVTVNIGTQAIAGNQILYAGAVASIPGLEQVNVQVPSALTFSGNSAPLTICVPGANGQPACSAPVSLYLH